MIAYQLMRPSGGSEGKPELSPLLQALGQSIGAADDEADRRPVLGAPRLQHSRQARAVEVVAALVQDNDNRPVGNDIGDGDRFFDAPPFGVLGAAFADFNNLNVADAECATGGLRALPIGLGKLAFGALL